MRIFQNIREYCPFVALYRTRAALKQAEFDKIAFQGELAAVNVQLERSEFKREKLRQEMETIKNSVEREKREYFRKVEAQATQRIQGLTREIEEMIRVFIEGMNRRLDDDQISDGDNE